MECEQERIQRAAAGFGADGRMRCFPRITDRELRKRHRAQVYARAA